MTVEKQARAASGWPMLFVTLAAYAASIWGMIQGIVILATAEEAGVSSPVTGPVLLVGGIVLFIAAIILNCGFFSLQPGQARVLVLFGTYVGTVRESGFYWANPIRRGPASLRSLQFLSWCRAGPGWPPRLRSL